MSRETLESRVSEQLAGTNGAAQAAALNEVVAAYDYPEFWNGVLAESSPTQDRYEALIDWAVRRGRL